MISYQSEPESELISNELSSSTINEEEYKQDEHYYKQMEEGTNGGTVRTGKIDRYFMSIHSMNLNQPRLGGKGRPLYLATE